MSVTNPVIYRALTASGDYSFGSPSTEFYTGVQAVAQAIYTRLLLWQNTFWRDLSDGLPMFQGILGTSGSQSNRQQIDTIIANRISGTAGVSQLISYESVFTSATRAYSFTTQVQTIYSPSPVYITSTGVNKGSAPQMQFYLILNDQYISLL